MKWQITFERNDGVRNIENWEGTLVEVVEYCTLGCESKEWWHPGTTWRVVIIKEVKS